MKEYKVEYTSIKKEYWCYVVKAESRSDAIDKVKKAGLDVTTADDYETAAQCQWESSSNLGLFGWITAFLKG